MQQTKTLPLILFIQFIEITAYAMLLPLIPFYAQTLGAHPLTIGWIFASYSILQLFTSPFLGKLSDLHGRKRIFLLGQFGTFLGFIILGFSKTIPLVFISRITDGLTGGNQTVSYAAISDITSERDRAKAFGYMGSILAIGLLTGLPLGIFLYKFGFSFVSFFAAAIFLGSTVLTIFFLPETRTSTTLTHTTKSSFTHYLKDKAIRLILLRILFFTLPLNIFIFGFSLFVQKQLDFNAQYAGYSLAFMGIIGILFQVLFFGSIVSKLGDTKASYLGFLLLITGFFVLSAVVSIPILFLSLTLIISGTVLATNTLSSLLTKSVSIHEYGHIIGLNQSINSICQILGPLIAGLLIARFENWIFGFTAALIALFGILFSTKLNNLYD